MFFKRRRQIERTRDIVVGREGKGWERERVEERWDSPERSTRPGIMSLGGSPGDSLQGYLMRRNVSTLNFNPITRAPAIKVMYTRFTIIVIRNFTYSNILTWIFRRAQYNTILLLYTYEDTHTRYTVGGREMFDETNRSVFELLKLVAYCGN